MGERNGQGIFIGVSVAVMCIAGLLFFFPDSSEESATPPEARGQVILPRTSSPSKPRPKTKRPEEPAKSTRPVDDDPNEIWQVIYLGEHRIGYSRTRFETVSEKGRGQIRSISEMRMQILRYGQTTRTYVRSESLETTNGDLLSMRTTSGSGRTQTVVEGRADGDRFLVETTAGGNRQRRTYPWKRGIKSARFQDRLLRSSPMKPGETRRFTTFLPALGRETEVRISAMGYRHMTGRDGKRRRLLRVRVSQSVSPNESEDVYLDERGWPVISDMEFIGNQLRLRLYAVSKTEALKTIEGAELDLGVSTLIRVPNIRSAHQKKKITYRIYMAGGDPAKYLPDGPTQQKRSIGPNTVELTVTSAQVPRRRVHVAVDREFLDASRFLQTNDPRVRDHAHRAAGYDTEPSRVAMQMERYVHQNLKNKNFSTALGSAAEVAKYMQGDCTEHAVLLAAILRVRRIPSRIAVGLVYVPAQSSFGAHMWTEAWIHGQWVPLDPTMGQGGTGPAHIKLADTSFSDKSAAPITAFVPLMNILGRWRIEVRDVK